MSTCLAGMKIYDDASKADYDVWLAAHEKFRVRDVDGSEFILASEVYETACTAYYKVQYTTAREIDKFEFELEFAQHGVVTDEAADEAKFEDDFEDFWSSCGPKINIKKIKFDVAARRNRVVSVWFDASAYFKALEDAAPRDDAIEEVN